MFSIALVCLAIAYLAIAYLSRIYRSLRLSFMRGFYEIASCSSLKSLSLKGESQKNSLNCQLEMHGTSNYN